MKFKLKGGIRYAIHSCRDDKSVEINEEIKARNADGAIKKARKIIQKLHKDYRHYTDYCLGAGLYSDRKKIWETYFKDDQPAEPFVPAQQAKLAVQAHFEEKRIV